jgi:hypothetical protein
MPFPTTKVEISFTATAYERNPATWVDVTTYVRNISIRRGRSGDLEQFPTGTASVILDNRDRRFDPFNTAGPYYGNLVPRRQIRVTASTGGAYVPVFRGWVSGWPIEYTNAGHDATTSLQCFDVLGLIAEEQTLADVPAYFGSTILRYRMNDPVGSPVFTSEPSTVDGVTSTYTLNRLVTPGVTQTPFTSSPPLAPAFPYESVRLGASQAYRSEGVDFTPTAKGGSLSFWMAREDLSVGGDAVSFNWGEDEGVIVDIGTDGTLFVYFGDPFTSITLMRSNTKAFANFSPHHVYVCLFYVSGVATYRIFIDGVDAVGLVSSFPIRPFIRRYGQIRISDNLFQDIVFEPETSPGMTYEQHSTRARLYYGSGVGSAAETSRAKAERVLNRSALPAAWVTLDNNPESILGSQGAGLALVNELQKIADSEGGELFATKDGQLRLTNRSTAAANGAGTDSATFADIGAGLRYGPSLAININADEIINRLGVTFAGGGEITTDNTASITANGVAETSLETYLATKAAAADFAETQVGIFARPIPQWSALEVSITQDPAEWATILGLELLDKISVTITPKAGAPITQPLIVNSITHEITPGQWLSTVQGSARYVGWFVIGRSLIGGPDLLV